MGNKSSIIKVYETESVPATVKVTYFVPIYKWGGDPSSPNGTISGTTIYSSVNNLVAFEPEAVAFFKVEGTIPAKNDCINKLDL